MYVISAKNIANAIICSSIDSEEQRQELANKIIELEKDLPQPSYLLKNEAYPFYDTTSGESVSNTISLINLNSIKDFELKINQKIEFERFRGNIYISRFKSLERKTMAWKNYYN